MERRKFIKLSAASASIGILSYRALVKSVHAKTIQFPIKAVAFDAFTMFDIRSAFKHVKELFPDHGDTLRELWLNKLFGYSWLQTLGHRYTNFTQLIEDSLDFSIRQLKLHLTAEQKTLLLNSFSELDLWPDVISTFEQLRGQNIRLALLSNMTELMLRTNMQRSGIEQFFEFVLSTDRVRAYKPASEAYQMGIDAFGLRKEQVAFAAFGGWDAVGASWFGYPTVWVNRVNAITENLDAEYMAIGKDYGALMEIIRSSLNK